MKEEVLDRNIERILDLIQRTPAFMGTAHSDAPDLKAHARVGREAAAQGMVLLRNAGALPLPATAKVALFGNASYGMVTGGTGSGDVNEAYTVSLPQGLKDAGLTIDAALAGVVRALHPGGEGEDQAAHADAVHAEAPHRREESCPPTRSPASPGRRTWRS